MEEPPQEPPQYHYPHSDGISSEVHLTRLDATTTLETIEHFLKGEKKVLTPKGDSYIVTYEKKYKVWCNEEGLSMFMTILSACGPNKDIFLSNLTKDEIYNRCNGIWKELSKLLGFGYVRYGVKKEDRGALIKILLHQIHSALSRCENGKEASDISKITQHIEHTVRTERPQQKHALNPARLLGNRER